MEFSTNSPILAAVIFGVLPAWKALEPAFAQILPALFGGLGVVFISKNWKISIAPVILMLILFVFVPALNASTVGIVVPVSVVFTVAVTRFLYKKTKFLED